jgi:hypothetical protein
VKDAYEAGELPPQIDIQSISAALCKPFVSEMTALLDLQHLACYFEHKFLLRRKTKSSWGAGSKHLLNDSPHLLPIFKDNFRRALYRYFVVGAVLSHAYLQPFFEAEQNGLDHFLRSTIWYLEEEEGDDPKDWFSDMPFAAGEFEYLVKHPIYNFTPHPEWESCFGPAGDWLVGEARARLKREAQLRMKREEVPDGADGQVLQEIIQVLVIYGQLSDLRNGILPFGQEPFWTRHYINENDVCMCHVRDKDTSPIVEWEHLQSEGIRTASAVFFWKGVHTCYRRS